jgi:hypothetical protein
VFGKQDTAAINLSVIAAGKNTVGFVIKGESRHDYSGFSVSSAGFAKYNIRFTCT